MIARAPWVSLTVAVMWVAYGKLVPQKELDDALVAHAMDGWPIPLDPLVEALENRAAGNWAAVRAEKRVTKELFGHAHGMGANITHLRRRHGLDRAALLMLAKKKLADSRDFCTRWAEASRAIMTVASADPVKLRMVGLRGGNGMTTAIPFTVFLDPDVGAQVNGDLGLLPPAPLDRILPGNGPARDVPDWRAVWVNHDDLEREFPQRAPGKPDPEELAARMRAIKEAAPRLNRESAISQLRGETGCSYRHAKDAWAALPPAYRASRAKERT
jgi:hypothetical protein